MDVLGNFVDHEGRSIDQHGKELAVEEYFISDGIVKPDLQREGEYTKILADRIVERYYKDNLVLSSHLVAFVAFTILRQQNKELDLYALLRIPAEEFSCPMELMMKATSHLVEYLRGLETNKEIQLSADISLPVETMIRSGVSKVGNYHALKALKFEKNGTLVSEDFKLLYYYHNRLENYKFHKIVAEVLTKEVKKETTVTT